MAPDSVLKKFGLPKAEIGPHPGGFSGARLWRVGESLCLRAWPSGTARSQVEAIHHLLGRVKLPFVPIVIAAPSGATLVEQDGRLWELTTWLSGRADFHDHPTPARLENACHALARLHRAWAPARPEIGPCPAIARRRQTLRQWQALVASGWKPRFCDHSGGIRAWSEPAWNLVARHLRGVASRLEAWKTVAVPLQPCLCDVWHDHMLFDKDAVTGLVDYGSVKVDHVAVDLARLLGSLVGDHPIRTFGLKAYQTLSPLKPQELELIDVLDRTGVILGTANWLKWLYHERREYENWRGVLRRIFDLVTRMEVW